MGPDPGPGRASASRWRNGGDRLRALRPAGPRSRPIGRILPILKVGRDLAEEGRRFLREIPRVDDRRDRGGAGAQQPGRAAVPGRRPAHRAAPGGVPRWTWPELSPLTELCDALYVELHLGLRDGAARRPSALRMGYGGPTYADLHSLFLGMTRHGDAGPAAPGGLDRVAALLRRRADERRRVRDAGRVRRPLEAGRGSHGPGAEAASRSPWGSGVRPMS